MATGIGHVLLMALFSIGSITGIQRPPLQICRQTVKLVEENSSEIRGAASATTSIAQQIELIAQITDVGGK